MNDLLPTWFKDDVWIWVIVKGQVLVWGPKATKEACIGVCVPCHLWDFYSSLGHHLWLCRYLRALLPLGPQWHSDPGQAPCLCLWSVLLSSGPWCHQRQKKKDAQGLRCIFRPCWCLRSMPPPGTRQCNWLALSPETMMFFVPVLLLRPMSGTMTLPQPGSMLMSIPPDTIEGHENAKALGYHLGPYRCQRTMLPPGPYSSRWTGLHQDKVILGCELLPSDMLGFVVLLLYLGSVLMFMVQVTTWGHRNHVCWSLEDVLSWPCFSLALFFVRSRMGGLVQVWILEQQCWPYSSGENWSSRTPTLRKDGSTPQQCLQLSWAKH